MQRYLGQCHCGAVKFAVDLPEAIDCYECNCSICQKLGYLHLLVAKDQFELLKGASDITEYRFNTEVAIHTFCRHCGVKAFYTPRSNPHGVSVNWRCLDNPPDVTFKLFDGQHWEQNSHSLRGLV